MCIVIFDYKNVGVVQVRWSNSIYEMPYDANKSSLDNHTKAVSNAALLWSLDGDMIISEYDYSVKPDQVVHFLTNKNRNNIMEIDLHYFRQNGQAVSI